MRLFLLITACDGSPSSPGDDDPSVGATSDTSTRPSIDITLTADTGTLWADTGMDTDVECVPKVVLDDGPPSPAGIMGIFDPTWDITTLVGVHGNFGSSVPTFAGDVDGDGFSDIVLGWYDEPSSTVGASIFLGPLEPGVVTESPETSALLLGVASLSWHLYLVDGDGDGRAEILGSAYPAVPWTAYVAPTSGVSDVDTAEATFSIDTNTQALTVRQASDGDLWVADPALGFVGAIFGGSAIYRLTAPLTGELSSADAAARYEGPLENPVGLSVDIGDLDGDGVDDVVTSGIEFTDDAVASYRGRAWFVTDPPLVDAFIPDVASTEVQSPVGDWQPLHATMAGDLDGDGHDDVLLSAQTASDDAGLEMRVFYGPPPEGTVAIDCATTTIVHDEASITTVSVGDFNSDGLGDFLARAQYVSVNDLALFYGPVPSGVVPFSDADAMLGYGTPVPVGDATGDGIDDVFITSPFEAGGVATLIPGG
jgi:hypothetical protein